MIPFQDVTLALDVLDDPAEPSREAIDATALGELTDSIAVHGLLQPIGARGPSPEGRYEVIWGHRRTLSVRSLQWATIPARVCPWSHDPLEARLTENLLRADLNPREEARSIAIFLDRGRSVADIARTMRRSVGWVDARRQLLSWPPEIQDQVASGALSFAVARLLADVDHESYRNSLIEEARRTGATAPVVAVWLAHYAVDRDRIIRNAETVEQIMQHRETFVVMYICEGCREQRDSAQSALLRVCPDCLRAIRDAARSASAPTAAG